jgi:hypothetical protein
VHWEQNSITFVVVHTKESAIKVLLLFEMLTDGCVAQMDAGGSFWKKSSLDCVELVCDIENLKFLCSKQ